MTSEDLLRQEFRQIRRSVYQDNAVRGIPLPKIQCTNKLDYKALYVKGIEEEYFNRLNGVTVEASNRNLYYIRDRRGNIIKANPLQNKQKGLIIETNKVLGLPFKYQYPEGFGYFGYITGLEDKSIGNRVVYLYLIPKINLYAVNTTALVLSNKKTKCYAGREYITWKNGVIYLTIIPYDRNAKYTNTVILDIRDDLNYGNVIKDIEQYWLDVNLLGDPNLLELHDGNLVIKDLEPALAGYKAISDENILKYTADDIDIMERVLSSQENNNVSL